MYGFCYMALWTCHQSYLLSVFQDQAFGELEKNSDKLQQGMSSSDSSQPAHLHQLLCSLQKQLLAYCHINAVTEVQSEVAHRCWNHLSMQSCIKSLSQQLQSAVAAQNRKIRRLQESKQNEAGLPWIVQCQLCGMGSNPPFTSSWGVELLNCTLGYSGYALKTWLLTPLTSQWHGQGCSSFPSFFSFTKTSGQCN